MENKHKNSDTGFTTIYCCYPFEKSNHKIIKSLRPVQGWMFEINSKVRPGMKICDSYRKQLLKEKNNLDSVELDKSSSSQMDTNFIDHDLSLKYLNKSLSSIEESPIIKKRLQSTSYCKKKLETVTKKLTNELVGDEILYRKSCLPPVPPSALPTVSILNRPKNTFENFSAILKNADLASTSAKKVRQQLEEKLDTNLLSRKKEIDTLVMEFVNSKGTPKKKSKKDESEEDDEENEEEEDEEAEEDEEGSEDEKKAKKRPSGGIKKPTPKKAKKGSDSEASEPSEEGESEEEYSPKKSKPPKTRKLPPKKKKGSESDSDEDWAKTKKGAKKGGGGGGKRAGSGYTKTMTLSPELSALSAKILWLVMRWLKRFGILLRNEIFMIPKINSLLSATMLCLRLLELNVSVHLV
ncbi:hypothetical protein FQR65_LT10182 [Abscondita terminalis]|nr:hypothetical protein FQR65_LT10182 [Abscondita terminalis]